MLLAGGCGKIAEGPAIKKGSKVKIHYTLTVEGQVIDRSDGREPLSFVQGSGQMILGVEEALEGLQAGAKKEFTVAPEKGYGTVVPAPLQKAPKKAFVDAEMLELGSMVSGQVGGKPFQAQVAGVEGEHVLLDLNHPLAGKTLSFAIEVVAVE